MDRRGTIDPALDRFAEKLRAELGADRVLLFGSQARGDTHSDSDYDIIVVSPRFGDIHQLRRGVGLRDMWREVGGRGPMDLFCLTPDEFDYARSHITLIQAVLPEAIDLLPADVPA